MEICLWSQDNTWPLLSFVVIYLPCFKLKIVDRNDIQSQLPLSNLRAPKPDSPKRDNTKLNACKNFS